ncbi:MAG TPA: SURF1 family protein, partial [Gammaproteobacteria bacterium]|nr:SURF1 family protein [Gammaproteobacteria bacterium]
MLYLPYRFKPKLISSLATLAVLPILLSLGFWQLGRMEEKEQLLSLQAQGLNAAPMAFQDIGPKPLRYAKVKVSGKFLPKFSILLEHQMFEGQPGYHVLSPLAIAPDLPLLWIDRGWVGKNDLPAA